VTWQQAALCRGKNPDRFVPDTRSGNRYSRDHIDPYAYARQLCQRCPVAADCLAYALEHHPLQGMWGGTVASEREALIGASS
jgi:WhiB family redox-sensing transcriptional regulator